MQSERRFLRPPADWELGAMDDSDSRAGDRSLPSGVLEIRATWPGRPSSSCLDAKTRGSTHPGSATRSSMRTSLHHPTGPGPQASRHEVQEGREVQTWCPLPAHPHKPCCHWTLGGFPHTHDRFSLLSAVTRAGLCHRPLWRCGESNLPAGSWPSRPSCQLATPAGCLHGAVCAVHS